MNKHTPGPWMWDEPLPRSHAEGNWQEQAPFLVNHNIGETVLTGEIACANTANARLIAAAPELLEALEELLAVTGINGTYADKARAIIAKAKGETI